MKSRKIVSCMFFSKNGVLKILCLLSTTAKGTIKYRGFGSIDEKQVTEKYCLL